MGVPKFYRWISERYPSLSEVVKEYQIPEFDNLYLDMNGIIHVCSHPNDDDPHFRITEEQIFKDIFHYIEVLFRMIQPRKIFFMAVDGVAPRAKMNQQRGRRFRSAREAEENEKKAKERGEELPAEARFDSNCITPGTDFMARLDKQLQYLVTSKVSTDILWQGPTIIYSGHQTPGEGEHKIMEYIRYARAQESHDPNTRHCLYGLDADLVMLGLTSHEQHFSLLREEVKFGKQHGKAAKRTPTAEETTFHLLHLSLLREYLKIEFKELNQRYPDRFDVEKLIDDWVFMGFLVGNDFIPHLPGLHINKEGLPILYKTYMSVFGSFKGYLNEGGTLNLRNFDLFMKKLLEVDVESFQDHTDNMKYIRGKKVDQAAVDGRIGEMEAFDFDDGGLGDNTFGALEDSDLTTKEVKDKLQSLGIEDLDDYDEDDGENSDETQFEAEFRQHKRHYYMTKMGYSNVNQEVLYEQATNYVRGLQWILHYYYNGLCSWSWYYPFHYSPYISDVKNFAKTDLNFEKSQPFLPFEQLLAVLPPASLKHLPQPYHKLMLSDTSPVIDYYPQDFTTDLNGKQQEWEAVVLIPFIDETRLLSAMADCNLKLTEEEGSRNRHGPMYHYKYTANILGEYKSPGFFPDVSFNRAELNLVYRQTWDINPALFKKGLLSGAMKDIYYAGFPSLKYVNYTSSLKQANVKVFQQPSRGESVILKVRKEETPDINTLANQVLGKPVFINWPHLTEAKVESIFLADGIITLNKNGDIVHENQDDRKKNFFDAQVVSCKSHKFTRWGIDIGPTDVLLMARQMSGRKFISTDGGRMTLEKQWSDIEQCYPLQTTVLDINVHDPVNNQFLTVEEYFAPQTNIFMLGHPFYGCMGNVLEIDPQHKGRIRVTMINSVEPQLDDVKFSHESTAQRYVPGYVGASRLGLSTQLLARLTGTILLGPARELNPLAQPEEVRNKLNIGLNLKSNKKNEEVVGFTRKDLENGVWLYSDETIKSLAEYSEKFPEVLHFLNTNYTDYSNKSRQPGSDFYYQDDIFPKDYKEKMPLLTKWLKEGAFAAAERYTCGSKFVDPKIVEQLIDTVEGVNDSKPKSVKMQVKPHLLFKPNPHQGCTPPDTQVTFELFDRVINIREGFSVPLGLRGTVTGIQPADEPRNVMYDVVFDTPFPGGLTLAGPKSRHRCYRLHWATIINMTHGARKDGTAKSAVTPLFSSSRTTQHPSKAPYQYQSSRPMRNNNYESPSQGDSRPYRDNYKSSEGAMKYLYNETPDRGSYGRSGQNSGQSRGSYDRQKQDNTTMPNRNSHGKQERQESSFRRDRMQSNMIQMPVRDQDAITPLLDLDITPPPKYSSPLRETKKVVMQEKTFFLEQPQTVDPPQPCDLPTPKRFPDDTRVPDESKRFPDDSNITGSPGNNTRSKTNQFKQIFHAEEVSFILHGTFYRLFSSIYHDGLRPSDKSYDKQYIACLTRIPPKVGNKTYELFIYLDLEMMIANGMKVLLSPEGNVLVPVNEKGCIPVEYFKKVVDSTTDKIIYPTLQPSNGSTSREYGSGRIGGHRSFDGYGVGHTPSGPQRFANPGGMDQFQTPVGMQQFQPPVGMQQFQTPVGTQQFQTPVGTQEFMGGPPGAPGRAPPAPMYGRGRGSRNIPTTQQPMQLYENIWSQMQTVESLENANDPKNNASNAHLPSPSTFAPKAGGNSKISVDRQATKTADTPIQQQDPVKALMNSFIENSVPRPVQGSLLGPVPGPLQSFYRPLCEKEQPQQAQERKEVTVRDLFQAYQGKAENSVADIPSQATSSRVVEDSLTCSANREATVESSPVVFGHKATENINSCFVPTQVIRNITPKKMSEVPVQSENVDKSDQKSENNGKTDQNLENHDKSDQKYVNNEKSDQKAVNISKSDQNSENHDKSELQNPENTDKTVLQNLENNDEMYQSVSDKLKAALKPNVQQPPLSVESTKSAEEPKVVAKKKKKEKKSRLAVKFD